MSSTARLLDNLTLKFAVKKNDEVDKSDSSKIIKKLIKSQKYQKFGYVQKL